MAIYKSDQKDILFNLNKVLNVSKYERYGFDEPSVKEILNEYDKFVENEIFPTRIESDEFGVKMTPSGIQVAECLKSVNKAFYDMGWFALGVPENAGGTPVPEALAAACRSLSVGANTAWSMYPGLSKGAFNVLRLVGDEYLQKTYVKPMIEGRYGGTMCLTEAGAGSDVGALKTTAKPIDGEDKKYKISGTKIFISSGESDLYENNVHLVLARTPGAPEGTKGISLFAVPRFHINEDGTNGEVNDVKCSGVEHKMGIHASATCVMSFGDEGECIGHLVGNEYEGMQNMFIMMNEARLDCGMQAESQANLAYELTKQYVSERTQFKTEIINHPDVKKMMLKMRAMSRGLRSLILYTADLFDRAHDDEKYENYIGLLTPICKSFCSDQGFQVAVDAVQAHGGYGYCTEYGIEQFVRDIKIASIYEGTNGIQALDFVMRKILKDQGKSLRAITEEIFQTSNNLDDSFTFERGIFSKAMAASQEAMGWIGKKASKGEMSFVMQSCKDFLDLCSHIVVAWRLMESAIIAKNELQGELNDDDKHYFESKIVDFKVYCSHYLVNAIALSKSITSTEDDYSKISL